MGYIYIITNTINNKQYVGQTSFSIEDRFKEHIKSSQKTEINNRPLYKAMNKYGINNFIVELLEECEDSQLSSKEQYWINKLNTYHNGYNATLGGEGTLLYDHDLIFQKLKNEEFSIDIQKELGCDPKIISKIAKDNNIVLKHKNNALNSVEVDCYDKNNNFIQHFVSMTEASKWLIEKGYSKVSIEQAKNIRGKIALAAKGKRKTAYGFIWKYTDVGIS